ncbi:MAG: class I SAM-dependent methyltransferase [Spirochaetales bacterium]|nr:class I SAM-dependent methyltransferase [Spirochaetales bacterium]
MDIGCATGEFCLQLAKNGIKVHGIDLNDKMINLARNKAGADRIEAGFDVLDMLKIVTHFKNGSFSLITCFGNTLPHLRFQDDVRYFFIQVSSLLDPKGIFIFQVLNYDKILADRCVSFPVIKKDGLTFTREYKFEEKRILFKIGLKLKGEETTESVYLLPLKNQHLIGMLEYSGFSNIHCYSDYRLSPFTGKEFAVIYVAEK